MVESLPYIEVRERFSNMIRAPYLIRNYIQQTQSYGENYVLRHCKCFENPDSAIKSRSQQGNVLYGSFYVKWSSAPNLTVSDFDANSKHGTKYQCYTCHNFQFAEAHFFYLRSIEKSLKLHRIILMGLCSSPSYLPFSGDIDIFSTFCNQGFKK